MRYVAVVFLVFFALFANLGKINGAEPVSNKAKTQEVKNKDSKNLKKSESKTKDSKPTNKDSQKLLDSKKVAESKSVELKIIGSVPFGSSNLRLEANRELHKKDVSVHKLSDITAFIDVSGTYILSKKEYNFPNNAQVSIAQKSKNKLRILITLSAKSEFDYQLKNKFLYIIIKEKVPPSAGLQGLNTTGAKGHDLKKTAESKKQDSKGDPKGKVGLLLESGGVKGSATLDSGSKKQDSKAIESKPLKALAKKPPPVLVSKAKPTNVRNKKIIILDAGHGGKDCGAMGATQTCEKDIVLSVAKVAAKELDKRGYIVYMTRNTDVFIELQRRTEMANEIHADLFISIHANSVPHGASKQLKGVETYFLSTARTQRAVNVAANENQGIDANDYSPTMIASFLTSQRIIASNKLGIDIQAGILKQVKSMYNENLDGGVREGPFWVLVGALMPSVLVEIGYNSSPTESSRLKDPAYQNLIAKGIANGIQSYVGKNP